MTRPPKARPAGETGGWRTATTFIEWGPLGRPTVRVYCDECHEWRAMKGNLMVCKGCGTQLRVKVVAQQLPPPDMEAGWDDDDALQGRIVSVPFIEPVPERQPDRALLGDFERSAPHEEPTRRLGRREGL